MSKFVKSMDGLPKVLKVILALPFLDIIWAIYRVVKSASKNNTIGLVLGVLLIIFGIPFLWLIDIITIVTGDRVLWID